MRRFLFGEWWYSYHIRESSFLTSRSLTSIVTLHDTVKKLYKSIDKRSKKEYSEILQNLGNKAPKSYNDFQALSHSEKESLRYDNRIVNYFKGDIHEKLSEKQKQQAVEAYFNFKNDGIVFGDHAIARYIERMRRNDGTFTYNYETVKTAFSLPYIYISG